MDANSKRKSADETLERLKRLKTDNENGVENPYLDLRLKIHKLRSGAIEKIRLRNFMCHSSLEVTFNRHINFIVGRNGSGKSAILTAIVVGLGGKASTTNRASSLKDFIKKGCASATIEITLSNDGFCAYKNDFYGDKIVVTRTINASGQASYKVKGVSGDIVGSKREDVDMVISGLNIQVENPISVLNQDCARTFLADSNPNAKYSLFLKATRMDQVTEWFKEVSDMERSCTTRWESKMKVLETRGKEIRDLRHRLEVLQSLQDTRDAIDKLQNELIWAEAKNEESKLVHLKREQDKENAQIPEKQAKINKYREQQDNLQASLGEITSKMKELQEDVRRSSSDHEKAVSNHQVNEHKYNTKMAELREHRKNLKERTSDIIALQEVLKESERDGPEREQQRREMMAKVYKIDEEIKSTGATENTTMVHCNNLKATIQHYEREMQGSRSAKMDLHKRIEESNRRIRQLQSEKHGLSIFGSHMPHLIKAIEDADRKGLFRKKPVGPLGAYLKVKDAKWTATVENLLGIPLLYSFCCHCPQDGNMLKKIVASVIPDPKQQPISTISAFYDEVHDVSGNLVYHPQYQSLFNVLDITHPVIANCLIDRLAIEHILLIPTNQEACGLLSDRRKVPRNCKRAVTLQGDTYYPDPDYRTYAGYGITKPRFLQVSSQQAVKNLMEEMEGHAASAKEYEQQIVELHKKIVEERKAMKGTEDRLQALAKKKRSLMSEKTTILDNLPVEPGNREALGEELADAERQVENSTLEVERLQKEIKELQEVAKNSKKQVSVLITSLREKRESLQKLQSDARATDDTVNGIKNKLRDLERSLSTWQNKLTDTLKVVTEQEEKVNRAIEKAKRFCPEVETDRYPQDIREEITQLQEIVKTVESESGQLDETADLYRSKKNEYDLTSGKMRDLRKALEALENAVISRRRNCQNVMRSMSMRIKTTFHRILNRRKYEGNIIFSHDQKTLIVRAHPINGVQTSERDAKTLSGGERSYSTMAFIMALWEAVEPPFFIMDEFDVFMDKVNRGCVIELLLTHARSHAWFQYLFLTPQDTSSVRAASDLRIIEMGT